MNDGAIQPVADRSFTVVREQSDGDARLGRLRTHHGVVQTPVFMPVGTQGTVKAVSPRELGELGAEIILGNTYHLNLRPGMEIMRAAGGLHRFMAWPRAILTDSGGYQVFSLARLNKVTPEGVAFRSHLDGSPMFLGPAEAMAIQRGLGSDIAMVLDECPPYPCERGAAARSLALTMGWAERCLQQERAAGQLVFGIVQGSVYPELRREAAEAIAALPCDGCAIGGVSVGEPEELMIAAVEASAPFLPADRPRYLMGVGTPPQLVEAVARGVDMFDCVLPTRVGRNGGAFTRDGMIQIKAGKFKDDFAPIEAGCGCYACSRFSRAYVRHLLNAGELLGLRLVTLHNLHFYLELMRTIRRHLAADTFASFRTAFHRRYVPPQRGG